MADASLGACAFVPHEVQAPPVATVVQEGIDSGNDQAPVIATTTGKASCLEGKYQWRITNLSQLPDNKVTSKTFIIGDFKWKLLVFPRGNNMSNADFMSVFLDVTDALELPHTWSRGAKFTLRLVNQRNPEQSLVKDTSHNFTRLERDWGFAQFVRLDEVRDPAKGFMVNDSIVLECDVGMFKEITWWNYDSKKETGYVGLKNQGATCYMNSLLQFLFHIPFFRQAVYGLPTTEADEPAKSIPLAMQILFYKLQFDNKPVGTKELTKSFGWDSFEAFQQHDVQELNRVLCENLEEKMKKTDVEGTIQKLFEGHMVNYIECVNVDFKSTRKEEFLDLQLQVKDCKDVYESFDKYCEVETLDGDNLYEAEGHGKQPARKGVLFQDFPPVLQLQLKRFEYDMMRDMMVKINDRYEFPLVLDLGKNGKYMTSDADLSKPARYLLHSVLVHSGGVHGGHYYSFVRPDCGVEGLVTSNAGESGQWYKFDDDRVTKEDEHEATELQFGGDGTAPAPPPTQGFNPPLFSKLSKYSNAYMLVYVRECDVKSVLCPVTKQDIAQHLHERVEREAAEKARRKKELEEAHMYTQVKVARDEDMRAQIGKTENILFDLIDYEKIPARRVLNTTTLAQLKEELAQEYGVPATGLRFWLWAKRVNKSCRPSRSLADTELQTPMDELHKALGMKGGALELLVETPQPPLTSLPVVAKGDMLLFFKFFDPVTATISFAGYMYCNNGAQLMDYCTRMRAMVGLPANEELLAFEEIKYAPDLMCEPVDMRLQLSAAQLEDGDIIVFQSWRAGRGQPFETALSFLEYRLQRQTVVFRPLDKPVDDDAAIEVELSRESNYDDVTAALGEKLGLDDPTHLRLTAHNVRMNGPRPGPLRFRQIVAVGNMVGTPTIDELKAASYEPVTLYYERLSMPLHELETLKTLKVDLYSADCKYVSTHTIHVPPSAPVAAALAEVAKAASRPPDAPPLRLVHVHHSKIFNAFEAGQELSHVDSNAYLRAEEVPEDDAGAPSLLYVYHVEEGSLEQPAHITHFGEPMLVGLHDGETVASVKARIQRRLSVSDEDFAKWKFHGFCGGQGSPLRDGDVVADKIHAMNRNPTSMYDTYLGVEHANTGPRRPVGASRPATGFERSIKISG